jgi:hypothetical protein
VAAFASASGDFNPLHTDLDVSRRLLYGTTVVHGMYGVMWALEALFEGLSRSPATMRHISAEFRSPIRPGDSVELVWRHDSSDNFVGSLFCGGIKEATSIQLALTEPWPPCALPEGQTLAPQPCREWRETELESASGSLPLFLNGAYSQLFPSLARVLDPLQSAVLLSTTRLVGMECPGLASLFARVEVTFSYPVAALSPILELEYRVKRWFPKYRSLDLCISAPGANGTISVFLRPGPVSQPSLDDLKPLVRVGEFKALKPLIVGGSRGLGEVTAKLLAAGGADVALTYCHLPHEAERVVAEIRGEGLLARALRLDVHDRSTLAVLTHGGFDRLYYFATPPIQPRHGQPFHQSYFEAYANFYVAGLQDIANFLAKDGAANLGILYPSSVFCDEAQPGFAEYLAAKLKGEELCAQLASAYPGFRVLAPRFPMFDTDQTQSILPTKKAAAGPMILEKLRQLERSFA